MNIKKMAPLVVFGRTVEIEVHRMPLQKNKSYVQRIVATCEGHIVEGTHTLAPNPGRKDDETEKELNRFISRLAQDCAGHVKSKEFLDKFHAEPKK